MPYLQMETNARTTLSAAHDWVFQNLRAGTICPCCEQVAAESQVKLVPVMAVTLRVLVARERSGADQYVHCEEYLTQHHPELSRSHNVAKLCHWGLLMRIDGPVYCVTDRGREFVAGRQAVPAYGWSYNQGFVMDRQAPLVYIGDVLREPARSPEDRERSIRMTGHRRRRRR